MLLILEPAGIDSINKLLYSIAQTPSNVVNEFNSIVFEVEEDQIL